MKTLLTAVGTTPWAWCHVCKHWWPDTVIYVRRDNSQTCIYCLRPDLLVRPPRGRRILSV